MKLYRPVAVEFEVAKVYFAEVAPLTDPYEEALGTLLNHW
jgi:hypothetical protein